MPISNVVFCPKSMVGRVIGRGGDVIKKLQMSTGARVQIDQSTDPARVSISGHPHAVQACTAMVEGIASGSNAAIEELNRQLGGAAPEGAGAGSGPLMPPVPFMAPPVSGLMPPPGMPMRIPAPNMPVSSGVVPPPGVHPMPGMFQPGMHGMAHGPPGMFAPPHMSAPPGSLPPAMPPALKPRARRGDARPAGACAR